ncbi:hypothetical protein OH782_41270 (plasmid) [Streptomyces sp. NBC_01544]|uniref:hypothetical protein n=1 Tax=Streptomyces sp. NBC_01544 TaxID=2975871 RepID=UPI002F90F7A7
MNSFCEGERAADLLMGIFNAVGNGQHLLTASARTPDGPMSAMAHIKNRADETEIDADEANRLLSVLTMTAGQGVGALVVRTRTGEAASRVIGWHLGDGAAAPVSRGALFDAYCTDPATGEPIPPEPGVEYADAPPVRV